MGDVIVYFTLGCFIADAIDDIIKNKASKWKILLIVAAAFGAVLKQFM